VFFEQTALDFLNRQVGFAPHQLKQFMVLIVPNRLSRAFDSVGTLLQRVARFAYRRAIDLWCTVAPSIALMAGDRGNLEISEGPGNSIAR
jgi:hypothetical protein